MKAKYVGSGIIIYNSKNYNCNLYSNEKKGFICLEIVVNEAMANFLEIPIDVSFLSGELSTGYKFTLIDCHRLNGNGIMHEVSYNRTLFKYTAKYYVKGVNANNIDKLFTTMVFSVPNILAWGEQSGYSLSENYNELTLSPDKETTIFKNDKMAISYSISRDMLPGPFQLYEDNIVLKQNSNIIITLSEKGSCDDFTNIFIKIKRLIELSILNSVHISHSYGLSDQFGYLLGESKIERPVDVICCELQNKKENKYGNQTYEWLTLIELCENNSFKQYFDKYEKLEPIIDLYIEIIHNAVSYKKAFLNLVQALETYHSRFVTNKLSDYKKRVETLLTDNNNQQSIRYKEFLLAESKGFITLESRLADLLLARFEYYFDTGDIDRLDFPKVIAKTRNYYIHYDESIKDEHKVLSEEELGIYNRVLFHILEYYLLREIGFSDQKKIEEKLNLRWHDISRTLSIMKLSKERENKNKGDFNE